MIKLKSLLKEVGPDVVSISPDAQAKIDKAIADTKTTLDSVLWKRVYWVHKNMNPADYGTENGKNASSADSITKVELVGRTDGLLGITFGFGLIKSPIFDLCLGDPGYLGVGKENAVKQVPITFENIVKHVFNGTTAQGEGRSFKDRTGQIQTFVINTVTSKDTIDAVVTMLTTLSQKYGKGMWSNV